MNSIDHSIEYISRNLYHLSSIVCCFAFFQTDCLLFELAMVELLKSTACRWRVKRRAFYVQQWRRWEGEGVGAIFPPISYSSFFTSQLQWGRGKYSWYPPLTCTFSSSALPQMWDLINTTQRTAMFNTFQNIWNKKNFKPESKKSSVMRFFGFF